jgi:hypothetical protein
MSSIHNEILNLGKGFWEIDRKLSGKEIDIIKGQNIPSNSKTIDRTLVPNGIVSHKSTNLRLKSYQSTSRIIYIGCEFINKLLEYKGEKRRDRKLKASYYLNWAIDKPESPRILEWYIPVSGITSEQEKALLKVKKYALENKVILMIIGVLD